MVINRLHFRKTKRKEEHNDYDLKSIPNHAPCGYCVRNRIIQYRDSERNEIEYQ